MTICQHCYFRKRILEMKYGENVSPIKNEQTILNDIMRFSIDSTCLIMFNPGIASARQLETIPANRHVEEEHRIPYKSRSEKCESADTKAKLITNI